MKRTTLRKVGKIGKANIEARKKIAKIAEQKGLDTCELNLENICIGWPRAPVHRHKRAWYKGDVEKLSDYQQWLCGCQACHDFIEHKPIFTEELFMQLRGPEVLPEEKKRV